MDEPRRQQYLRALGLTPWVAHRALPGAPPSPSLHWPEPATSPPDLAAPSGAGEARVPAVETAAAPSRTAPPSTPSAAPPQSVPAPVSPSGPPSPPVVADLPPSTEVVPGAWTPFTLLAWPLPGLWLVAELERPDAPEPGREAQRLLASLMALWDTAPGTPRRLVCPPPRRQMTASEAAQATQAFLGRLTRREGRVLLLCEAPTAQLLGLRRYQPGSQMHYRVLAVSSLREMLQEPVTAKRQSWQAMLSGGFHGR